MKVRPIIKKGKFNAKPIVSNQTTNPTIQNWAAVYECEHDTETLPEYRPKEHAFDTCRCVCKSSEDIIKVNNIIHKFNHTQVDISKQALIQVGRQHRDGITIIYITIMASDENNVEEKFADYNAFLYEELSSAEIEFQFVNFENIKKNVADVVSYTEDNDSKMLVIDRNTINNDKVFDIMCQYIIPGIDTNYIKSMRIPYNEIVVTADCKWKMIDTNDNGRMYVMELEKKDTKNKTAEKLVQMNISIFDRECNKLFDSMVKCIGNRCIRKIIADYIEENDGEFFRTIHMLITDDAVGKSFYSTSCNFGVATYIENK